MTLLLALWPILAQAEAAPQQPGATGLAAARATGRSARAVASPRGVTPAALAHPQTVAHAPGLASAPAAAPQGEASQAAQAVNPQAVNPYLAGWFRPTPVHQLPDLAARHLMDSAYWTYVRLQQWPQTLADTLPRLQRVQPTGGRELIVANIRCPAELATGQYLLPANAMREVVNAMLERLNEARLLPFDLQLVCS